MGRTRKSRKDLPERMYFKHNAYWYLGKDNKWQRLGVKISEAYRGYADIVVQRENITLLKQVIEKYQKEVLPDKAANTITNETTALERLKKVLGDKKPRDIKPSDIYQYMEKRAMLNGKTQANYEKIVLSNLFNAAIKWGMTDTNPCKQVKKITIKANEKHNHYLTDDEFLLLYSNASPFVQTVMDIAYLTGLRKGDILKIKFADIQEKELHVLTQKTKTKMVFQIEGDLAEVIKRARALRRPVFSPFLFCAKTGKPMSRFNFDNQWQELKKKCGLGNADIHFHDIRAKALTDADRQGFNAQLMAGHATREMTDHYIKTQQIDRVKPLKRIAAKQENIRQTP
jgi:integrase